MREKIILLAILFLPGMFLVLPDALAEVFKWVDDKGTIHFTEDESAVPEKYRDQVEKRFPQEGSEASKEKVGKDKPKRKESTKQSAKEPEEKQRLNVRKIESDAEGAFKNIISLWKDKKYDDLYDYGDWKSRTHVAREDFRKRMERKVWELALSWETIRDIQVDVKNATLAYVTARIGYRAKHGGETRIRTETYKMKLESGTWRIDLTKVLRSPQ